jgi:2,4-dienoyl-CoA reductase-like NADH-dependent reductase (Old Yellow Enzyme family)
MTTVAYCAVSKDGAAFAHEMWMREEIVPILKELTDAVHKEGAAASIQLAHCGFFAARLPPASPPSAVPRVLQLPL